VQLNDQERGGKKGKGKGKKGKDKGKGKGKKGRRNKKQWWNSWEDPPDKFDDEHWEEPREETGLALIGEMAPKQYKWKYELYDESRRSYAGFLSCPFRKDQCETFFNNIKNGTDWLQPSGAGGTKVPRKTAWMVKKGCQCVYRYGSSEVPPQEYPPWMNEILRVVMPMCGCNNPEDWPDSCNMNLYEDGQMSVGWHADDEQLFQGKYRDIAIISLSFGQKRSFELRLNHPEDDEQSTWTIMLGNGDLCTMEGMTQKHFQHRVPKEEVPNRPRINLTWRWILKHTTKCPAGRKRKPAR
jgi:alkylated DNA repair dioxygenase AlkB